MLFPADSMHDSGKDEVEEVRSVDIGAALPQQPTCVYHEWSFIKVPRTSHRGIVHHDLIDVR